MNFTLIPDSRRPCVALVCDENGAPIEYAPGRYKSRWPFNYEPSAEEVEMTKAILTAFPKSDLRGISPRIENGAPIGRFEIHHYENEL